MTSRERLPRSGDITTIEKWSATRRLSRLYSVKRNRWNRISQLGSIRSRIECSFINEEYNSE